MEAFAQSAGQQSQQPNLLGTFALIPVFFLIFYFFLIKPQQDKEKKRKEMINNLKKGDRIVTSGGLFARVVDIKETYIVAKIGNDVKIEISKEAVSPAPEEIK